MTLGGSICIRNGNELDYCFVQAIESLLPICDVVSVCDIESTDGTQELLREWCQRDSRIRLCVHPWTDPQGDPGWWPAVLNYARQHCPADYFIHLDADEVLHEDDYGLIKDAALRGAPKFCKRLNFWKDGYHLIPDGVCCGTEVLRMAPTNCPIPSDYPYGPAEPTQKVAQPSDIRIFHYGFLRAPQAFFRKARVVEKIWVNDYDRRLEAAEKFEGNWMEMPGVTGWENGLVKYDGTHPKVIHDWLKERKRL